MTLLDRFRAQARDKHSDPAVRLAFVDELPLGDRTTIAAVAREDEDPRVRRAAVAKLMEPGILATIASDDRDDQVRAQAVAMLRDIALEAFEETGEAESLEAVDKMVDPRGLAQIAKGATRESVALRALASVQDAHVLGSVARHAVVDSVRRKALDRLVSGAERDELVSVAMHGDFNDTAVAAIDLMTDHALLEQVIARGKNKSAVKRARAILREAAERAARETADAVAAQAAEAIANTVAVLERVDALASPPHGDPLGAHVATEETPADAGDRRRRDQEAAEEAGLAAAAESSRRHARLKELASEAVAIAAEQDFAVARTRFSAVRREWRAMAADITVDPALAETFVAFDGQMTAREQEVHEADARARREALGRVHELLGRLESLAGKADVSLKTADRALRDIRTALSSMPRLPSKRDFDEVGRRLKAVQAVLTPKAAELREADEWKRFANATVQEQLCARMEALRSADDLEAVAREVRELQQQWRASADVPRAQSDALWRRFKTAHDDVWARCEAHFAAQHEERTANLAKKVLLCEQAEAQAASTSWLKTAEEIKHWQAEWKTIGPVPRGRERAIWDRFRSACDRFFTRRHEDLAQRKASWAENLAKKDALSAQAEALAESTDWDRAAAEIKRLQGEWKTIGPVRKTKSDAVWQRFRGACDTFFSRYAQRHDTARAERIAARESLCAEIEALASGEQAPDGLSTLVRALRGRWQEMATRPVDPGQARQFDERFGAAFTAVLARWPEAFTGTDMDVSANRKRMEAVVQQVEDLARSLDRPALTDTALSPTNRLAAMLKEALAANTIGGKVDDEVKLRAVAEEARQAQAAWTRIGLVPEEARRPLADRFQRAIRAIGERIGPAGPAGHQDGRDRRKSPGKGARA